MKKHWILAALLMALLLGVISSQQIMAQETQTETDTEESIDADEVLREVDQFFREGEFEAGIEVLEEALEKDPNNFELMVGGAQRYTGYGIEMANDDRKAANVPLLKGAALMRRVQAEKKELTDREKNLLAVCVYNEACCAAIDEKTDEAFKLLRESMELGFTDTVQIENDTDFESIREDERFEKILEELEALEDEARESRRPSDDA